LFRASNWKSLKTLNNRNGTPEVFLREIEDVCQFVFDNHQIWQFRFRAAGFVLKLFDNSLKCDLNSSLSTSEIALLSFWKADSSFWLRTFINGSVSKDYSVACSLVSTSKAQMAAFLLLLTPLRRDPLMSDFYLLVYSWVERAYFREFIYIYLINDR